MHLTYNDTVRETLSHRKAGKRKQTAFLKRRNSIMLEFWVGGILAVLLLVYLVYVLIKPEEF